MCRRMRPFFPLELGVRVEGVAGALPVVPHRIHTPAADVPADDPAAPILVSAKRAAELLGVGLRTFRAMDAAGRIPVPLRLSAGCVRWRLAELREWADAGAPDRTTWNARRAAEGGGR
jgi:prophage regulatory protein